MHGFAFKGEYFRNEPPGDVLLTPGNFAIGGGFKGDSLKYYDGPVPQEYVLEEGDLVITMTDLSKNGDTLGYPALIPRAQAGLRYLHNQRLGKALVKDVSRLDKQFLYHLLRTRPYRHEVLAGATGTTVRHTSPERIGAFRFLLPPLSEQRAIAHILSTLDDKIELNRRMNETLEGIARAIFKCWFVDFDPVRAKVEGRDPGPPRHIADLFPDSFEDSEMGEIPAGWRLRPIGDVVDVVGGGTPSTSEPVYWEGGTTAFCTPRDMASLTSPAILETERHLTPLGVRKVSSGQLPTGTVLLSSRAPIGYLAIAEIPVSINQGIVAIVCRRELPNLYVLFWAQANMDRIEANANGSTFLEVSKSNFRRIPAVVPDETVLCEFMRIAVPFYRRTVANLQESRTLARIRDSLLPKLISGELRISDADRIIGRQG